jgi:hypothetical protein
MGQDFAVLLADTEGAGNEIFVLHRMIRNLTRTRSHCHLNKRIREFVEIVSHRTDIEGYAPCGG